MLNSVSRFSLLLFAPFLRFAIVSTDRRKRAPGLEHRMWCSNPEFRTSLARFQTKTFRKRPAAANASYRRACNVEKSKTIVATAATIGKIFSPK